MKKILIYSIPYGYGPTGKAIAIANELSPMHMVTLTSFHHSLQIMEGCNNVKIIDCKSRNFSEWDRAIFTDIDILISVMDLRLIKFVAVHFPHIRTVFVDSLFWWRKTFDEIPFDTCDLFLIQTFPGVAERIEQIPLAYRDKFYEVSPITTMYNTPAITHAPNHIVLHFGGVNSLIAHWTMYTEYFEYITETVFQRIRDSDITLTVAGNQDLMNYLTAKYSDLPASTFQCLSNRSFHETLNTASLLITTCGIEATHEAFQYEVPTIFLPPVNGTQLYQSKVLIQQKLPVIHLSTLAYHFDTVIQGNLDYKRETAEISRIINTVFTGSEKIELEGQLARYICNILHDSQYRNDLIKKQNEFSNNAPYNWQEILSEMVS